MKTSEPGTLRLKLNDAATFGLETIQHAFYQKPFGYSRVGFQ